MKSLAIKLVIILIISSSLIGGVSAANSTISNITLTDIKGNWAENLIKEAVSKGIIKGYSDGTFRPNNPISSVESYAIAFRTAGVVDDVYAKTLKDWTVPYVDYYKTKGYDTDTFNPELTKNDTIASREKALYVLLRAKGIDFGYATEKSFARMRYDTKFTDVRSGDSYAMYMRYAKDHDIISGYGAGEFGFGKNVTRAEFVKMALGIFGRNDLMSASDYSAQITSESIVSSVDTPPVTGTTSSGVVNDGKYASTITYSDNIRIKDQSFEDSTKKFEEGKHLYNGHWYFMQSQEYYDQMNIAKTPIQTAGNLGTSMIITHTVEDGWKFTYKDGIDYSKSGDIQRMIDIVRYNDNFYFGDLNLNNTSLGVFGGVSSFSEFEIIYKQVTTNYGNYTGSSKIFTQFSEISFADNTFNVQVMTLALHISLR